MRAAFSVRRPVSAMASAVGLLLSPHASAAPAPVVQAEFAGFVEFGDGCGGNAVCFTGDTSGCHDTVSVGSAHLSVTGCSARTAAHYAKVSSGGVSFCAGVGVGGVDFTDFAGSTLHVDVVVAASEGKIVMDGRYVDVVGRRLYTVHAVVTPACAPSAGVWSGTLTAYNY